MPTLPRSHRRQSGIYTRRRLLQGVLGVAGVGLLAACNGQGTSGTVASSSAVVATTALTARTTLAATAIDRTSATGAPPAAATTAPAVGTTNSVNLQLFTGAKIRGQWLSAVAKMKAQEQGTPITLDVQVVGNWVAVTDKLQTILAGGATPPDLVDVADYQFPRWIGPGRGAPFVPLNDRLQGRAKDLFTPSALDPWTWEGKYYALGDELNASLLSVRSDLFKQAAVDPAKIVTWDDFLQIGRKIKTVATSGITYWSAPDFTYLAMQAGGGIFAGDGKPTVNSAINVQTLTFVQNAIVKEQVVLLDPGGKATPQLVKSGAVAAMTGPAWKFSGYVTQWAPESSGEWRLQPLPTWSQSGAHASWSQGGTGTAVPATGKQTAAALDFLFYANLTKAVLLDYDIRTNFPTWRGAYSDPKLQQPVATAAAGDLPAVYHRRRYSGGSQAMPEKSCLC